MVRKYTVVHSESIIKFEGMCNEFLDNGWECVGGLVVKQKEYLQSFYKETGDNKVHVAPKVEAKATPPTLIERAKRAVRPKK